MTISFFTAGTPRPGGSKRVFPIRRGGELTGKFIVTDSSGQAGRDWRASVVQSAFDAMRNANLAPMQGALRMNLAFVMPRPKYHFRSNGQLKPDAPLRHIKKPDQSKTTRLIEDSMTGIVYMDDAQICEQFITKNYTSTENPQPGCAVEIIALDDKP
jgi:Holliday junction resolvase RusA-like endonuclease